MGDFIIKFSFTFQGQHYSYHINGIYILLIMILATSIFWFIKGFCIGMIEEIKKNKKESLK
jgi:hypothetical protein